MSFGLGHGRELDPGLIGVSDAELPPMPDSILSDPESGRVDPRAWFQTRQPLEIEIGSGKGTFMLEQARAHPETNFLGIEIAGEFYAYAADRIRRAALTNARMLRGDAVEFFRWRCPAGIARVVHLYFSDPWPKTRHHKNRVVQDRFLAEAWRVLEPRGELRIVTDHDDYWQWMERHFSRWTNPEAWNLLPTNAGRFGDAPYAREAFERPAAAGEGELVGTNFERKYRREGRPFHAVTLRRS
jgi:tRNA (guanine-N7-)-methyltransferase